MAENNLFLGIDLGTTNSVLAYAHFHGNKLQANVVKVPRTSERGSRIAAETLPSVVFYRSDRKNGRMIPVVGDYAKAQYGKKYGYVVKSVKSSMGQDKIPYISPELPDQRPEEASAQILRHLLAGGQEKLTLKEYPTDVVITIPASFDADMREATYKAANLAGIEVYNKDGSYKDILLYEPKAVLYNFINEQLNGEIPDHLADFTEPKNILVYDIGGGTLDVSVHRVSYDKNSETLDIEDLGISLHHLLAGDDFDALIAHNLMQKFLEETPGLRLGEQEREELLSTLSKKAEEAKVSLSDKYVTYRQMNGESMPEDTEEYISEINLYKGNSFEYSMTKEEMDEWIRPLLAEDLKLSDYQRIESLGADKIRNIIYPVLDAMSKAAQKQPGLKIDSVILNGGMSKFYPIVERLRDFFGLEPVVITDPDMSVAKGAVIYHYYMHKANLEGHVAFDGVAGVAPENKEKKNFFTAAAEEKKEAAPAPQQAVPLNEEAGPRMRLGAEILNNTLSIAIHNGYVEEIAPAGTELPYISPVIEKFALPSECDRVSIPFYVGRGKTTQAPNRRIASRVISFKQLYPGDTRISMQVGIDRQGLMHLKAWITDNPSDYGEITVSATGEKTAKSSSIAKIVAVGGGRRLDPAAELHELAGLSASLRKSKNAKQIAELSRRFAACTSNIKSCSNPADFGKPVTELLFRSNVSDRLCQALISIGRCQYHNWSRGEQILFYQYCAGLAESTCLGGGIYSVGKAASGNSARTDAINAFTLFTRAEDEALLKKIIALHDKTFALAASVVYAKRGFKPDVLADYLLSHNAGANVLTNPLWAVGKSLSRETGYEAKNGARLLGEAALSNLIEFLDDVMLNNGNPALRQMAAYALGEIADQRSEASLKISGRLLTMAKRAFDAYLFSPYGKADSLQFAGRISMVKKMLDGESLSVAEGAQLLKLRESA